MLLLGIDPGVTTGVAQLDSSTGLVEVAEDVDSVIRLHSLLEAFHQDDRPSKVVIVESFVGAGPRTKEAVQTMKVWGFVEFLCRSWNLPIVLQAPQQRKHRVPYSKAVLPDGPHHAQDALAHILAYDRSIGMIRSDQT